MKKIVLVAIILFIGNSLVAQQWFNLNLNHLWDGEPLNYGDIYTDENGNALEITRVQYYLSGLKLTHDGGLVSPMEDVYVLASGNVSHYSIGMTDAVSLESLKFDLGVDADHNHLDPLSYPSDHPLAPQNPNMHWGWSAGYKFVVIEGNVDSNGDQIPDKLFQFHAVGDDHYLQNVIPISTAGISTGAVLTVDLNVDISKWLKSVDLVLEGTKHGVYPVNGVIMTNTNTHNVFAANTSLSNEVVFIYKNNIYFDYSQSYAPVIFYKFPKATSTSLKIMDLQGRIITRESNLNNEGNYFLNMELSSGTYLALFILDNNERLSEKFYVRK